MLLLKDIKCIFKIALRLKSFLKLKLKYYLSLYFNFINMVNTLLQLLSFKDNKPWSWIGLSMNPNIDFSIIKDSLGETILDLVLKHPDWNGLSYNPSITFDIVLKNPDKPWNWIRLSKNPNITSDDVLKNPDKPWNWIGLSENPNITFDIVLKYPDKPWDWYWLSRHPNITFDIVLKYP